MQLSLHTMKDLIVTFDYKRPIPYDYDFIKN